MTREGAQRAFRMLTPTSIALTRLTREMQFLPETAQRMGALRGSRLTYEPKVLQL